jgi:hypothetical protein
LISELGWQPESDLGVQCQSRFENPGRILRLLARLVILFCVVGTAHAQYGFEVWTVDNGMPENQVRGITQTPDGDLRKYQNGQAHSLYTNTYQLRFGKAPISRSRAGSPIKVKDEPNDRIHREI